MQTVVALELLAYSLTQVGVARHGRIVGEVVVDSLLGGLFHAVGCVEVGLAYREAYHVFALRFQFAGFGGHGEGLALGHVEDSIAEDFHSVYVLIWVQKYELFCIMEFHCTGIALSSICK